MIRSALLAVVVAAVVAAVALIAGTSAAFADDAADAFRLKAFDRTAMIETQDDHGKMLDVPMRPRRLECLVLAGRESSVHEAAIGDDGMISIPRAKVAKGATITLRTVDPASPTYVAAGIDPWAEPAPQRADFVRLATRSPLYMPFGNLVVTVQDPGQPTAYIRVNVIAQIANPSSELWTGPRGGDTRDALRFPVPAGFTMVSAKRGNDEVECTLETDAAGRCQAVIAGGMFAPETQSLYRIVLTGKWEAGATYDLSFKAGLDIAEWNLAVDPVHFSYDTGAGGGTVLQDGGLRPAVNGVETRVWLARQIPAGTPVSQVFVQGRIIDPKVWRTIAIFVLTAAGAILLARALAGTRAAKAADAAAGAAGRTVPFTAQADDAADRESALGELRRRRDRGEITEFEHNARRAVLLGQTGDHATAARATAARAAAPHALTPTSPLEQVRQIEARADAAGETQLRADVRTLAALVRELLRK